MFRNIRNTIVGLLSAVTLVVVPVAVPAMASASATDLQNQLCAGVNTAAGDQNGGCDNSGSTSTVTDIAKTIINIFSLIVGIVSVIMIILGGFRYITSGGDSNNVSGAKNTIIYAIIGLVVVALAQFIVGFVLNKVTGS